MQTLKIIFVVMVLILIVMLIMSELLLPLFKKFTAKRKLRNINKRFKI